MTKSYFKVNNRSFTISQIIPDDLNTVFLEQDNKIVISMYTVMKTTNKYFCKH